MLPMQQIAMGEKHKSVTFGFTVQNLTVMDVLALLIV